MPPPPTLLPSPSPFQNDPEELWLQVLVIWSEIGVIYYLGSFSLYDSSEYRTRAM